MTNKSKADSVHHDMVAAHEKIKFIYPRLQQRKFEQRATKRHRRALNRGCQPMGFLDRILRAYEVIASKLKIRVINRLLENLAIHPEKGGSERFGLAHHLTDRALKQTRLDRALDSHKIAQLPPRTEATRFLRKPYIQLSARQRKCPVIEFHRIPSNPQGLPIKPPSLCQPLAQTLRPYIGPVLFDVVQTRRAVRFAVHHPPAGWNIGESRPQAVLLLVIYQDKKAAIVVVKRVDAHLFS